MKPTHGESKTRLFKIWSNMIQRCTNEKYPQYFDYGGRGIGVCDEWKEYIGFSTWAKANGYSDDLTLDRRENDKGYSPHNCRWVSYEVQNNNQRRNYWISYRNSTHTLAEWAKILNINYETLRSRVQRYHWSVEKALSTPARAYREESNNDRK